MSNKKPAASTPEQDSTVTPSPVMVPPTRQRMIEKRNYPVKKIPPAAHARAWYDPERAALGLTYNGCDILTITLPDSVKPITRFHSDGNFMSTPFLQQFVLSLPEPASVQVSWFAPVEMWNMRPRRAEEGEAILGQMGHPLLYGANGMYLPGWDLLVSWHGCPFSWKDAMIRKKKDGFHATMEVQLSAKPWVLLFRPRYYGEHLGFSYHKPWDFMPKDEAITGWCSWEAYHSDVTQENITYAAKALQPLKPYGLSVMQLDDGFQQTAVPMKKGAPVGDSWLNLNEKFPKGHSGIIGAMKGGGFTAGIWTNATLTNKEGAESLGICLKDEKGELIRGDWIQYVLDCKPETLARHVTPYYRAFREAGYSYFKSDSLRHLIYDGMQEAVRLGLMDDETARANQRAYMEAAREGIGEDAYYLSCWGVLSQSIGVCDAMRVATDSNPTWGAFSMQLRETARWFFAQRVLFTIDPDVVCVRGPLPWARMLLSLVALTGGLMMISDDPALYDEERMDLIKRTIPGLTTHAAETGPVDYTTPACCSTRGRDEREASFDISHIDDTKAPFSSLWATHFEQNGRRWCVAQRCAVVPLAPASIPVEDLALDPAKAYIAFDYWNQTVVPVAGAALSFPPLDLGDTTVVSLVEKEGSLPLLLGSDRHVSMDMVSVRAFAATRKEARLSISGFAGLKVVYTLYGPTLSGAISLAEGCKAACEKEGDVLRITVHFAGDEAEVVIA